MEWVGTLPRQLIEQLLPLYRDTDFAYAIAGAMGLAALVLAILAIIRHLFQMQAIRARTRLIADRSTFVSASDLQQRGDERESAFADNFSQINQLMSTPAPFSGGLETAWAQLRRHFIHAEGQPVHCAVQPASAFSRVERSGSELDFLASAFIAVGLVATFLGLIAALSFAADGMRSGDALAMQASVRDLITASASKFVTSIAGVGLSIVLRVLDRVMQGRFARAMRRLVAGVESCVRPVVLAAARSAGAGPRG